MNKRSEYGLNNGEGRGHPSPSTNSHRSVSRIHPSVLGGTVNPELNTFFPFDPYRLPKSNVYIQGVYRDWSSVAIDDDEEEDEDNGEEEDEEEDDEHLGSSGYLSIPRSDNPDGDELGLGESLGAMSISPLRPSMPVQMHSAVVG